jgi:CO/xanthine dehydrogenase Mo-binding subunit
MLSEKTFRNDAQAKVTGRARYAEDIIFPGTLHMVPVYSDYTQTACTNRQLPGGVEHRQPPYDETRVHGWGF